MNFDECICKPRKRHLLVGLGSLISRSGRARKTRQEKREAASGWGGWGGFRDTSQHLLLPHTSLQQTFILMLSLRVPLSLRSWKSLEATSHSVKRRGFWYQRSEVQIPIYHFLVLWGWLKALNSSETYLLVSKIWKGMHFWEHEMESVILSDL